MLKSKLLIILFLIFVSYAGKSQCDFTGVTACIPENLGQSFEHDYQCAVKNSTINMNADYIIPIVFHIYHNNEPTPYVTDQNIKDAVSYLNQIYSSALGGPNSHIKFALPLRDEFGKCTNGIIRNNVLNPYYLGGNPWFLPYEWNKSKYLNIHIFKDGVLNSGHAFSTPIFQNRLDGRVLMDADPFLVNNKLLAHEVGHYLKLFHLNDACDSGSSLLTGDFVCDTEQFTNSPISGCELVTNCNSVPITADNIMIQGLVNCKNKFTLGQIARMRFAINWAAPYLVSVDNNKCTVTGSYYLINNDPKEDYEFTGNSNWSSSGAPFVLFNNLIIKPGSTLTIGTGLEVQMCQTSKIIVEKGGKLILNGKLTGGCNAGWEGVEVQGDNLANQQLGGPYGYRQGYILCSRGSVIENARTGIKLYGSDNKGGGIANCDGLTFKNCITGVSISNYANTAPYKAKFFNCNFLKDNNFLFIPESFCGIEMFGVKGVAIQSCEFINSKMQPTSTSVDEFGYGIKCIGAGFELTKPCISFTIGQPCTPQRPNKFQGLGYGVYVGGNMGNNEPSSVKSANFYDCYFGIHLRSAKSQTILFNTFNLGYLPKPELVDQQIGLAIEEETSLNVIQENTFVGNLVNEVDMVGLACRSTGSTNQLVRRNTFRNLKIANLVNGVCGHTNIDRLGLQYVCISNSSNNTNDFLVPTNVDRMAKIQAYVIPLGSAYQYLPTLTSFSHNGLPYGDFENNSFHVIKYYHKNTLSNNPTNFIGLQKNPLAENLGACTQTYCELPCPIIQNDGLAYHNGNNTNTLKNIFFAKNNDYINVLKNSPSDEIKQGYQGHLVELAGNVLHYMLYDTLGYNSDSIALWQSLITNYSSSLMSLVSGENEVFYESIYKIGLNGSSDDLNQGLKEYALKNLQSLRKNVDNEDRELSAFAKNILTSIGDHYLPYFYTGSNVEVQMKSKALKDIEFDVYPNPNQGLFKVELHSENFTNISCKVYNSFGLMTKKIALNDGTKQFNLDLSTYDQGIYFIEVSVSGKRLGMIKVILIK